MIDFVQLKKVAQEAQESQVPFTINSTQILELLAIQAQLVVALRKIAREECEIFDEDLGEMVLCCMESEEMIAVANEALAAAGAES